MEIASILADPDEGEIIAMTVGEHREFQLKDFVQANMQRLHLPSERVLTKVIEGRSVTRAILHEAADDEYDLVVIGSSGQTLPARMAHDPIPESVAKRCTKPLVMVRASAGIQSWIKRWI